MDCALYHSVVLFKSSFQKFLCSPIWRIARLWIAVRYFSSLSHVSDGGFYWNIKVIFCISRIGLQKDPWKHPQFCQSARFLWPSKYSFNFSWIMLDLGIFDKKIAGLHLMTIFLIFGQGIHEGSIASFLIVALVYIYSKHNFPDIVIQIVL